jgi:uncharacterized protein YxjI
MDPPTNPFRAPVAPVAAELGTGSGAYARDASPFARQRFLMRQRHLALDERCDVWDDQGNQVLFVERPTNLASGVLAALAAVVVFVVCGVALTSLGNAPVEIASGGMAVAGTLIGAGLVFAIAVALVRRRDVTVYPGPDRAGALLAIRQDRAFAPLRMSFTVVDAGGVVLAHLRKNLLSNLIRRRWVVSDPRGALLCVVLEDSILLSLLRRLLGSLFGLLRTNFVILAPDGRLLGRFNRSFTLLDRYILDLSMDSEAQLDRRLAVAIGIMLDTGERR